MFWMKEDVQDETLYVICWCFDQWDPACGLAAAFIFSS